MADLEKFEKQEYAIMALAVAGSAASIISFVLSNLSLINDWAPEKEILVAYVIKDIAVVVGLAFVMASLAIRNRFTRKKYLLLEESCKAIQEERASFRRGHLRFPHHLIHQIRDEACIAIGAKTQKDKAKALKTLVNVVLDNLSQHLLHQWKSKRISPKIEVAITLKILIAGDIAQELTSQSTHGETGFHLSPDEKYLVTYSRDYKCRNEPDIGKRREICHVAYSSHANTAFITIVKNGADCFTYNDLKNYPGGYKNENANWLNQYNAAQAVPVDFPDFKEENRRSISAILCADSMNPDQDELFDDETFEIMGHAADLLALIFLKYPLTQIRTGALRNDSPLGDGI